MMRENINGIFSNMTTSFLVSLVKLVSNHPPINFPL